MRTRQSVLLAIIVASCLLLPASAQEEKEKKEKKKQREEYSATAIVTGGGAAMVSLSFVIDSFTPDDEVLKLAEILKSQGPDGLAKAIDKTQRGRIAPVGRLGNDINIARSFQTEKGRVIRLVSNRPLGFLELRGGGRSTDYQFSVVELILNEKGEGEGVALAAAKIKFNKDNQLEVENYGRDPIRITNVRRY